MSELRHVCAEAARLIERIGDENTPSAELPELLTAASLRLRRMEHLLGLLQPPRPGQAVGSLLGDCLGPRHDFTDLLPPPRLLGGEP